MNWNFGKVNCRWCGNEYLKGWQKCFLENAVSRWNLGNTRESTDYNGWGCKELKIKLAEAHDIMTQNGDLGELLRIPFIGKKSRKSKSDREFLSLRATAVCIRENQSLEPQNPHQKNPGLVVYPFQCWGSRDRTTPMAWWPVSLDKSAIIFNERLVTKIRWTEIQEGTWLLTFMCVHECTPTYTHTCNKHMGTCKHTQTQRWEGEKTNSLK